MNHAIIYCRVSDQKQVKDGHGLDGQEQACRSYALTNGLEVVKVFHEEGITGAIEDRPAFLAMIDRIEKQQTTFKIIIDDMARLARDHIVYAHLKRQLVKLGCEISFVNMRFESTPEGEYVETILAATAELERKQNAGRTKSRMIERMKAGFYVFNPPFGYKYSKHPVMGKILVKDDPIAAHITEALEGFSNGRFATQTKVKYFLEAKTKTNYTKTTIKRLLERKLYAGIIDWSENNIHVKAHHEPLISIETYEKIQVRLKQEGYRAYDVSSQHLYPLRGFIGCCQCGNPLTAAKSKGRGGYYAYYSCCNKNCSDRGKTTSQNQVESEFINLLESCSIDAEVLAMTYDICTEYAESLHQDERTQGLKRNRKLKCIEKEIKELSDRFMSVSSDTLQNNLEKKIKELETLKIGLKNEPVRQAHETDFRTIFEGVKNILENPKKLWLVGDFESKQLIQRIVFESPPQYERRKGFRTAPKSLPFTLLNGNDNQKSLMVHQKLVIQNTPNLLGELTRFWELMNKADE